MLQPSKQFVFAYGSLLRDLDDRHTGSLRPARLRDHRRAWNVAMDNTLTVPGYKCYLDPRDGSRPAVFVTFLNLVAATGEEVNGALVPVRADELAELDRRERNYERREITDSLIEPVAGQVWTYFGKGEAEQRFADSLAAERAVVHAGYLEIVRAGFAQLGAGQLAAFAASTDPPRCPVLALQRVELH